MISCIMKYFLGMLRNFRIWLPSVVAVLAFFAQTGCGHDVRALKDIFPHGGVFTVWAHSDIHPRGNAEMIHYETAVRDVADYIPGINAAVVAGDIVMGSRSAPVQYPWFLSVRKTAAIPFWCEIAGNHDAEDIPSFLRYTGKPLHYAALFGNVLFICMSDEVYDHPTQISDAAFEWWKRLVIQNRDKIIVTMTHGCLAQSGLLASFDWGQRVEGSERFARVLREYPIDMWISGHAHTPYYMNGKWSRPFWFKNILFIDVSAIRKNRGTNIQSYILVFSKNSPDLVVLLRNHETHSFIASRSLRHTLRHPFEWDGRTDGAIVSVPQ